MILFLILAQPKLDTSTLYIIFIAVYFRLSVSMSVCLLILKQSFFRIYTFFFKIYSPDIHGVGLSNNISSIPAAVTDVRMPPRLTQECLWIRSSSRNRKKEERFPITPDSFRIAQKMPEFLVIVSFSEFLARKAP